MRLAAALAVLAAALPAAVSNLHPRIYVRHDAARIGRGLTVAQFRARLNQPGYTNWRTQAPGRGSTMERAARYLETADPILRPSASSFAPGRW